MPKFNPLKDMPSLTGKIAIVTGGNRGMGFHLTQQLANHGAKVYLAARTSSSAEDAISKIEADNPELQGQNRIVFLHLDLGTLRGAQEAAEHYLTLESRVDILIHNAALHDYEKTSDGVEDGFAVNFLGPFVFTQHLTPTLIKTSKEPDSDISSAVHSFAPSGGKFSSLAEINDPLGPLNSPNGIRSRYARYARSKLAGILFSKELQRHLDAASAPALSLSVDPGGVATETVLNSAQNGIPLLGPLFRFAISKLARGVRTRHLEFKASFISDFRVITRASKDAENVELAGKLWAAMVEITDIILAEFG
ncbi:NAD(P)-binding protein [Mycena filopes]|nr:NAD(P)-binding protein [Mycena filopes]